MVPTGRQEAITEVAIELMHMLLRITLAMASLGVVVLVTVIVAHGLELTAIGKEDLWISPHGPLL